MDYAEALDRAAKALAEAEHCAQVNPAGAEALVVVADGWIRYAAGPHQVTNVHVLGSVRSERELAEIVQRHLRRQPPGPDSGR
jgi:hypothetical protein